MVELLIFLAIVVGLMGLFFDLFNEAPDEDDPERHNRWR